LCKPLEEEYKHEAKETVEKTRKTIRLIADTLKESFFPEKNNMD